MKARLLWLPALLLACSEAAGPGPDAGLPPQDAAAPPADAAVVVYPALAPAVELEPEPVPVWMLGVVTEEVRQAHQGEDPVLAAIQDDNFACPTVGIAEDMVRWRPHILPESGEIEPPRSAGAGVMYLVACIDSDAVRGLVARADNLAAIFVNGAEQPSDFYRSGRLRLPLPLRAGTNIVVARGSTDNPRGSPVVRLWRTPHEVVFNPSDTTFPHLLMGSAETEYLGVPALNLREAPVIGVRALVEESEHFEATLREYVSLPAGATTQLGFELRLKAALTSSAAQVPVRLRVESLDLEWSYGAEVLLDVKAPGQHYRASFISEMDRSVQYFGVAPPPVVDASRDYGLILSLHGAGVQGIGQARAYGLKDWAYVVAATNRRPFGFDWEDWGRLDALEVLAEAKRRFRHDPTRVHVTGHSMGGHGTWHVGVTHPGLFAVIGPSAGWSHFDVYGGARSPVPGPGLGGAFAAAQQHSQTPQFLDNFARRAVYIIHGDADDNVPVRLGRAMRDALTGICEDLHYHEEPGAGHWWDGYPEPGAACVDWPDMMSIMEDRRLDPLELEFSFRTAGPWVSPTHSFVTVQSAIDPIAPIDIVARREGDAVVVTSSNARSLVIDGSALASRGVSEIEVDGQRRTVSQEELRFGPEEGKRPGQHGPLKEAFFRPFLFVYPDEGPVAYRQLAAYYTTLWSFIGNGHAPAVPLSRLTAELRAAHNVIYLGVGPTGYADVARLAVTARGPEILIGDDRYANSAAVFVFPEGDRLSAVFYATPGDERLLFGFFPFRSGFGLPDYLIFTYGGSRTGGFYGADWSLDPVLRR